MPNINLFPLIQITSSFYSDSNLFLSAPMQAVKQLEYSRLEALPAEVGISTFVD